MLSSLPTMDQLQLVISQAAAPAFILGAVASFLSVLLSHMARITDRSRAIHDLAEGDPKKERLKANLPQLRLRARILHRAAVAAAMRPFIEDHYGNPSSGHEILAKLNGVAATTGSACYAGRIELSPVLAAMGVEPEEGVGAVRFSLGRGTTRDEIDLMVERFD
jgi:Protein of unknown function (DUF2721)